MKTLAVLAGVAFVSQAALPPTADIEAAARTYAAGEHAAAVASITTGRVTPGALTAALDRWIASAQPDQRSRLTRTASAFAIDAAWSASRTSRTGGTVRPAGSGTKALEEIVDDFRTSYVLRYTPNGVPAAGWHDLDVRIRRPGSHTVRARKGYEGRWENETNDTNDMSDMNY